MTGPLNVKDEKNALCTESIDRQSRICPKRRDVSAETSSDVNHGKKDLPHICSQISTIWSSPPAPLARRSFRGTE